MTEEVRHHIERERLPWRRGEHVTECGRSVAGLAVWSRQEAVEQYRKLGQQRFAYMVCMTCMQTANRHTYSSAEPESGSWETDPVAVLEREASRVKWRRDKDGRRVLEAELRGLAALAEAHPDEFRTFVDGLLNSPDLVTRRRNRDAQRRFGA